MKKFLVFSILCFTSTATFAAEINIDSVMKSNVAPWQKQQTESCIKKVPKPICFGSNYGASGSTCMIRKMLYENQIKQCKDKFSQSKPIENITLTAGNIRYSEVLSSPLPISIKTRAFTYENCSSTPIETTTSEAITIEDGLTITTKDSIKTSAEISAKIPIKFVEIGIKGSREVDFSREQTTSEKNIRQHSLEIKKTIPPFTTLLVKQQIKELNSWFDFDGDIYLDGLVSKTAQYKTIVPNNLVTVRGQLFNVTSELSSLSYQEIPLSKNCQTGNLAQQKVSTKSVSLLDTNAIKPTSAPLPTRITEQYKNGMLISTASVIANVQVRIKSLDDEYCKVTMHTSQGSFDLLAKPYTWSSWDNLITHTSTLTTTISHTSTCKDGFTAEVSYYKK